jgi:hypothetical protein
MVRRGSRRVGVQCMQTVRDILLAQPMEGTREIPGATLRLECRERAGLCISAGALTAARPQRGRPMGFRGGHLLCGLEVGTRLLGLAPIEPGCGWVTGGCLPTNLHTGGDSGQPGLMA